jgi:hypothetical protein
VPWFAHAWVAAGVVSAVVLAGRAGCREPDEAPRVEAEAGLKPPGIWTETTTLPLDADNLECLLEARHGRLQLQFGYRGCFGGRANDLDLDVGTMASVTGHLWTSPSTHEAAEAAALTRGQGQANLRLIIDALIKEDEPNDVVSTTKAFVRVTYQCGAHRWGPFVVMTENPTEESERDWASVLHLKPLRHYPYSRVHGTIVAAQEILASVPP